ncbi:uncharacterized protein [Spinacia oleracea]|uniref:Reverse transcriptase zinc-binding domain-containing protein n=1 Tax=Spinacia oleracea TaxID=3562 RepID=A0A9R0JSQ0_SPIOL|nr:uncharacterized protein LOC110785029 [Spinacia oleracea]
MDKIDLFGQPSNGVDSYLQVIHDFQKKRTKEELNNRHAYRKLIIVTIADKISVQLLLGAFLKFSIVSGLEANMNKSNIYFGGVSTSEKGYILDTAEIVEGSLPFRYLEVPLSSKKLNYHQCKPLVDKILARAKVWSAKFLSYAGRLILIKTILFGMHTFWCQIFILPKRIIKEVEAFCRIFLWTGDTVNSKKALVAWERLYMPRSSGGRNVKNISLWNKVAIGKLLWALAFKKDKLWVQWIDTFYMKGQDPLQFVAPISCSWALKRFLTVRISSYRLVIRLSLWLKVNILSAQSIEVCKKSTPRLYTTDRIQAWGIGCSDNCVLCFGGKESVEHLF